MTREELQAERARSVRALNIAEAQIMQVKKTLGVWKSKLSELRGAITTIDFVLAQTPASAPTPEPEPMPPQAETTPQP